MIPNEKMQRAGENLKVQVANKRNTKEEKKNYMFDKEPPGALSFNLTCWTIQTESILPNVPEGEVPRMKICSCFCGNAATEFIDCNPLEIARQLVLMDFELFATIKPLEYLHFVKPSSWSMLDEVQS